MKKISFLITVMFLLSVPAVAKVCMRDKVAGTATAGANVTINGQVIEKRNGIVTVSMFMRFNAAISENAVIATLPDGFRPTGMFHTTLARSQMDMINTINGVVSVNTDGRIINLSVGPRFGANDYVLSFSFIR